MVLQIPMLVLFAVELGRTIHNKLKLSIVFGLIISMMLADIFWITSQWLVLETIKRDDSSET